MEALVSDLTYVRVANTWHYICLFIDLFIRVIIYFVGGIKLDQVEPVYKRNIRLLHDLFESQYFKNLDDPVVRKSLIDAIIWDADAYDKVLYKCLSQKYDLNLIPKNCNLIQNIDDTEITLSADIICGWKQIYEYTNYDPQIFIEKYDVIRSNKNLHFIWPKNTNSINQRRYSKYKDRIDFLLFDIKSYFEGKQTNMSPSYENQLTKIWLSQFNNDFKYFVDTMRFQDFVDKNYDVINFGAEQDKNILSLYEYKGDKDTLRIYFDNIFKIYKSN